MGVYKQVVVQSCTRINKSVPYNYVFCDMSNGNEVSICGKDLYLVTICSPQGIQGLVLDLKVGQVEEKGCIILPVCVRIMRNSGMGCF